MREDIENRTVSISVQSAKLTGRDGGATSIEVNGRIRSFERIARKHQVRYRIEKDTESTLPKWTVYFKASQADALTAACIERAEHYRAASASP